MNTIVWKTVTQYAIAMALGACTGVIVAGIIIKRQEAAEDWDENNEFVSNYMPNDPLTTAEDQVVVTDEKHLQRGSRVKITDYYAITRNHEGKPSLEIVAKEVLGDKALVEEEKPEHGQTKPYVISLEAYAKGYQNVEDGSFHEKESLTYYETDGVLTDSGDDVIPNAESILGSDGLTSFGVNSGDPDSVYIRNRERGTDYEVVKVHKSYEEVILLKNKRANSKGKSGGKNNTRKVEELGDDNGEEG